MRGDKKHVSHDFMALDCALSFKCQHRNPPPLLSVEQVCISSLSDPTCLAYARVSSGLPSDTDLKNIPQALSVRP